MKKFVLGTLVSLTVLFAVNAQDADTDSKPGPSSTASVASVTTFAATVGQTLQVRVWEKTVLKEDAYITISSLERDPAGTLTKVDASVRNVTYDVAGKQIGEATSTKSWERNLHGARSVADLKKIVGTRVTTYTISNKQIKILAVDTGASQAGFAVTIDENEFAFPGMVYLRTGDVIVRLVEIKDPEKK